MWANQEPFLVAEEGPRRLKHNTKNTKYICILNFEDVCQKCTDHKHQTKDW